MAKSPMMQHRHFTLIAKAIAKANVDEPTREHIANVFANELAQTNPCFDGFRFVAAAMGTPSNHRDR